MSGKKKKALPALSDEERAALEAKLADRKQRVKHFHEIGMTDTVWDAEIARIEAALKKQGVKDNTEVISNGS